MGECSLLGKPILLKASFFFALETKAAYKSRTVQSKDVGRVSKVVKFDELTPLRKLLAATEDFSNAGAEGGVPGNATMRGNSDKQRRYCLATNIDRIFLPILSDNMLLLQDRSGESIFDEPTTTQQCHRL